MLKTSFTFTDSLGLQVGLKQPIANHNLKRKETERPSA
jgi:hypothetical protein